MRPRPLAVLAALLGCPLLGSAAFAQQLEIRYINVGWGGSVLVKGPDGTTVLMEAGNTGHGTSDIVPYLQSIGIAPADGLDYTIAGHQHCDHIGGLDEVVNAGYDVRVRNYYNGSSYASSCADQWSAAASTTTAGALVVPTVGSQLPLGNGARLTFVAVNGQVIGGGSVAVSNENDRSIAVLIQYGGFDYLWASDLGGGNVDEACTGRFTSSQVDVETSVIQAISPGGAAPLISAGGIDVLHVNHHGSESSTNMNWMNGAAPAVALIGVGDGESTGWDLPRIDVVEHVLLAQATACITAMPALVLQTEEGNPAGSLTSFAGYSVGDVEVATDGVTGFTVSADGRVTQGPDERVESGLPRSFALDDAPPAPDTQPPSTAITSPADGATLAGTVNVAASASDNVGVTQVEFYLDGTLQAADTAAPYEWAWDTKGATNGAHTLVSKAYDGAGNVGSSTAVSVTVDNPPGRDVSGWTLTQQNATYNYIFPAGTVIPEEGYLIVARNASRAAFEAFWGVTLPSNVIYLDSAGGMPVINGDENYTLYDGSGAIADGTTVSMTASAGKSFQRTDPCAPAGSASSWTVVADSSATPGGGAGGGCGIGVVIDEFSDASGTGNYVYEFVELHYDSAAAPDTQAPTTSITAPSDGATVSGITSVAASASDDVGVTRVEFYLDGVLQSTDTSSPYAWSWGTTTAADGSHTLASRAYDAAGNVGTSSPVAVAVANAADTTPPTAPSGLTAAGAKRKINLSWGASTDDVGVTGYQVWRAPGAGGPFSQIAATAGTSYTDTGLQRGSTWYYYVTAGDAAGNVSAPSATASGTAR